MFFTSFIYNLFDSYYVSFYSIQTSISSLLFSFDTLSSQYLLICVFSLGFLTVFTPCLVSLLPLIFSYVNVSHNGKLNNFVFIIGVTTSLIFFVVSTNLFGFSFITYKLPILSYVVLILISLNLMDFLVFSQISFFFEQYIDINKLFVKNTLFKSYGIGLIIGSSVLPCNSSFLLILNFLLQKANNNLFVALCLIVYFFGFFFPLLVISQWQFNYQNIPILSLMWQFILPSTGSFIFVFSCFSLLKIIFI